MNYIYIKLSHLTILKWCARMNLKEKAEKERRNVSDMYEYNRTAR